MDPLPPTTLSQCQSNLPATTPPGDDEIDFLEIWNTLVDSKGLIGLITVFCFCAATALAFVMTPKYKAEVLAMPTEDAKAGGISAMVGQIGGLAEMAGVNLGSGSTSKEAAVAYLKSRGLIESFVKEKDLLPVLFAKKWDASTKKWKVEDPKKIPSYWDAYEYFSKKILNINVDRKTGLVTLSIEWKDREQAVEWANDLIKRANANLRQKAITETELSLAYLEKELQKTSIVEVQQAIFRVIESQVKSEMMANVREQFAFKLVDPAALMDEDAYVKPQRPLMMALGFLGGLVLGVLSAFIRKAVRRFRNNLSR